MNIDIKYVLLIFLVAVLVLYFAMNALITKDVFEYNCIKNKEKCTYNFLNDYFDNTPKEVIFEKIGNGQTFGVIIEKYRNAMAPYKNVNITQESFASDQGLGFALRLVPTLFLYQKEIGPLEPTPIDSSEFFGKLLYMKKTDWRGSSIQVEAFKKMNVPYHKSFIANTNITGKFGAVIFNLASNVCNLKVSLTDIQDSPSSENEACNMYNYFSLKQWCVQNMTLEDLTKYNEIKSSVFTDKESKECKTKLIGLA